MDRKPPLAQDPTLADDLRAAIREVPDFPKKGILFYDITTLLTDARCFHRTVDALAAPHMGQDIDLVVAIDARGFVLGAALAYKLGKGLVLVRKKGKLPAKTLTASYSLEYGVDEIEMHADAVPAGARVIIVDDSIVRGTTCKTRVNSLKEAGAKEVHVRVSCPPHANPCVYGIDFPDRKKLMAANHSIDEIRSYLNADSLAYLSQSGMVKATGLPAESFCMACYDGNYPVAYDPLLDKHIMERRRNRIEGLGEALAKEELQIKLL